MTHVFALAQMRGIEGAAHLVSHGLAALTGPLRAPNGSWYAEVVPTSESSATPVPRAIFSQRAQSAMIGAAAAAAMVGHDEARDLLADLEADQDQRWWDPCAGAVREEIEAAADALAAERLLVKLAERFPEIATDAAALHTHQVQWSLDQARDFQDWLRTKPGKENEVIDGRWPIRR